MGTMRMVISMEGVRAMTAEQKIERIRELIRQCEVERGACMKLANETPCDDLSDVITLYYGMITAVVEMEK